jgi:hypothetical protein
MDSNHVLYLIPERTNPYSFANRLGAGLIIHIGLGTSLAYVSMKPTKILKRTRRE